MRSEHDESTRGAEGEAAAAGLSRRTLVRAGALAGLALPLPRGRARAATAQAGTKPGAAAALGPTLRIGQTTPAGAIDPVTIADIGGLLLLCQVGEYLVLDQPDLTPAPMLALSWSANPAADVWTFVLRQGVKFHDGQPMTADDVVATMERLCNPGNGSNALSAFRGVLSPGGTRKIDDHTIAFHLDRPIGKFPYYVSSDNYNAIILPASYKGDFETSFNGTGPFRLEKYTPKVGASFVRNPEYWGSRALPARAEFRFYGDQQSQVLALQGGQVDLLQLLSVQGGQGLLHDPDVKLISLRSSAHREVHMRCDRAPFHDKRVRQALALTLNRPGLVRGLLAGRGAPGNDSPFAPVYPSTDASVAQRAADLARAKSLMAAAGQSAGFDATLVTERLQEIPDYAVLIKAAAKQIGINVTLKVEDQSAYYGSAVAGKSDWLDSDLGITDYGHRGVPDTVLASTLTTGGAWNAAHFSNPAYDKLVGQYVAAADLDAQRALAGQIETLLLDETPVIIAYFYDWLIPTGVHVKGVAGSANGQLFLQNATTG